MTLKTGAWNSPEALKDLVGEVIRGVIFDEHGRFWLCLESGPAVVFGGLSADMAVTSPSYGIEKSTEVDRLIDTRISQLKTMSAEIRRLTTMLGTHDARPEYQDEL